MHLLPVMYVGGLVLKHHPMEPPILYDAITFSSSGTMEDLFAELVEKITRFFGALGAAMILPGGNGQTRVFKWGFRDIKAVRRYAKEAGDHWFVYHFTPKSAGTLYLECKRSLSAEEHRLAFILAQTVERIVRQKKVEEELKEAEKEKALILDSLAEQLFFIDGKRRIKWANSSAATAVGMTPDQMVGRRCFRVLKEYCGSCRACLAVEVFKSGEPRQKVVVSPVGRILDISAYPLRREDGAFKGVLNTITDITGRVQAEEALRLSEAKYREIVAMLQEGFYEADISGTITLANDAACRLLGYESGSLIGKGFRQIVKNPYTALRIFNDVYVTGQPRRGLILEVMHSGGKPRFVDISVTPLKDSKGRVTSFYGTARDITERKKHVERLEHLGWHDALTGLYNRARFEQELEGMDEVSLPVTLIIADLDCLRLINDIMGHTHGDELLKACARVFQASVRTGDRVARIGGDEFAAILTRCNEDVAETVVRRIRRTLADHNNKNPRFFLSLSIGTATSHGECSLRDTFKEADNRMLGDKLLRSIKQKNRLIEVLATTLAKRDHTTEPHAQRLAILCPKLGRRLGLSQEEQDDLALLARIHNLGKVAVPDNILFKQSPLSPEERAVMQQHPEKGYRIVSSSPDLVHVARFVLCHHERWDGRGYPLGLEGKEIPLECRILALADAYAAMTSDRPYRQAMSPEEALAAIREAAGSQFDPQLAEEFIAMMEENEG